MVSSGVYEKEIQALIKISKAITTDFCLDNLLSLIVKVTAEAWGSRICSLMLLDDKKQELVVRATQSVSEEYNRKSNIKLGEGIAGRVALENRPITVWDVKKDPRYINKEIAEKEGLCSLLSVPLSVKGKIVGVLNCYTSSPHRFTKEEIDLLMAMASQAAMVIENTQLITQWKRTQEELETRKIVERAKGILMKEEGLSEEEAYRRIQKYSMDRRRSMREIAQAIVLNWEMRDLSKKR